MWPGLNTLRKTGGEGGIPRQHHPLLFSPTMSVPKLTRRTFLEASAAAVIATQLKPAKAQAKGTLPRERNPHPRRRLAPLDRRARRMEERRHLPPRGHLAGHQRNRPRRRQATPRKPTHRRLGEPSATTPASPSPCPAPSSSTTGASTPPAPTPPTSTATPPTTPSPS